MKNTITVKELKDGMRVSREENPETGRVSIQATLTVRSEMPMPYNYMRDERHGPFMVEQVKEQLLRALYRDCRSEMEEIVDKIRVSSHPIDSETFRKAINDLLNMAKNSFPHPVDKPT